MTDQNVQSGTSETVTETAPAPTAQESAKAEVGSLMDSKEWQADFSGENGRKAQVKAVEAKRALHETAYSDTAPEQAAPLPEVIQDGMDSPDDLSQAYAEGLTPAEDISDYNFTFADQDGLEFEEVAQMHTVAAEAAFAVGANPHFAQETVKMLDAQLARQDNVPSEGDIEGNAEALKSMYGDNAVEILEAAGSAFEQLPEQAQADTADVEDRAVENEGNEVLEGLGIAALSEITHIKDALKRIELGTFAICTKCGEEISAARLDAIPHTNHYITCES